MAFIFAYYDFVCYNILIMMELKKIIAANLVELRKKNKMTQAELAEKINYSDKAISKWEHGEALPDIEMLYNLCELYGVTLDYLTKEGEMEKKNCVIDKHQEINHLIIASLSVLLVWFVAVSLFVTIFIITRTHHWTLFIWAIPISSIVAIVFNGIWGKRKIMYLLITLLIWSLLLSFYLEFIEHNVWLLFILGLPAQLAVILTSLLNYKK